MTTSAERIRARPWGSPVHFLALGFGAGSLPLAPGTWGTAVAVPLCALALHLPTGAYLVLCAAMFAAGVWLCARTARDMGTHDHPAIVWDEIVGYFLTMAFAPRGWVWLLAGFVLFRIFDVIKPWPVRVADRRVHGGLGIMLDDVLAAVYAGLCLYGLALLWGPGRVAA